MSSLASSRSGKKRTKSAPPQQQQAGGEDDMNTSDVEDVSTSKKSRSTTTSSKQQQLGELEEQLKLARECKFPSDLVDKLATAEAHKQKDLKRANLVRDLKLREVHAHHEFLVQEANNTFTSKKQELQQQYCQEIEDKIKQITGVAPSSTTTTTNQQQQQQQQQQSSKNKSNLRRPRSKSLEDEGGNNEDESQPAASNDEEESDEQQQQQQAPSTTAQEKEKPVPKKSLRLLVSKVGANSNLSLDSFVLAGKEDIQSDLELIHANWMKRAATMTTTTMNESTEVNLCQVQDGNRLIVGPNLVLEKGSLVVVTRRGLDEEIQATITKVSANEVMIKQVPNEDGGGGLSARIPVSQLKSGRCAIRPAPTTVVASQ